MRGFHREFRAAEVKTVAQPIRNRSCRKGPSDDPDMALDARSHLTPQAVYRVKTDGGAKRP